MGNIMGFIAEILKKEHIWASAFGDMLQWG
jgi:hypothetical protein